MLDSLGRVRLRTPFGVILKYWAPPIFWMATIFYFSTDTFSGENTGSLLERVFSSIYSEISEELFDAIHYYLRKAGHFSGYAVLALLLFRACRSGAAERWRWTWAIASLLVVVIYALLDEYHQTFTQHRVGSIVDSLIDTSGALFALVSLWLLRRKPEMP